MTDIVKHLRWLESHGNENPHYDIVERLRLDAEPTEGDMEEAAAEIERLREALQSLLDVQNGPPLLGRYAEEWQAAVDQARAALGEDK